MQELRSVGVVHVIAASGMNVTFVASVLIGILGMVFKRQIALTIAVLRLFFTLFLQDLSPQLSELQSWYTDFFSNSFRKAKIGNGFNLTHWFYHALSNTNFN